MPCRPQRPRRRRAGRASPQSLARSRQPCARWLPAALFRCRYHLCTQLAGLGDCEARRGPPSVDLPNPLLLDAPQRAAPLRRTCTLQSSGRDLDCDPAATSDVSVRCAEASPQQCERPTDRTAKHHALQRPTEPLLALIFTVMPFACCFRWLLAALTTGGAVACRLQVELRLLRVDDSARTPSHSHKPQEAANRRVWCPSWPD